MNFLRVLRADLDASIEQTAAKLIAARMLELEDLERCLDAEEKRSQEVSSIVEKVKAQLQKD